MTRKKLTPAQQADAIFFDRVMDNWVLPPPHANRG